MVDLFGYAAPVITRSAVFGGARGEYRLRLDRDLGVRGPKAFVGMVNPSRGDGERDDHTITKLFGFSARNGFGSFVVANEFAFIATDVEELRDVDDPVGPDNDRFIEQAMREADVHIVAWGPLAKLPARLRGRWREVVAIADRVGCPLHCLGTAMDGQPLHPLTLGYSNPVVRWIPPS